MKLASNAIRRPVAVTVCVIIALLFGIVSLQRIGIDLLPNMSLPCGCSDKLSGRINR